MFTSEVLNKAADLIEERGWTQGDGWPGLSDDSSRLCLEGGIAAALGMRFIEGVSDAQFAPLVTCPAYEAVSRYLDRVPAVATEFGFEGQPLYWWNDDLDPSAGAMEVVSTLRAAAVIEAAREEQDAAFETYAQNVVSA